MSTVDESEKAESELDPISAFDMDVIALSVASDVNVEL